MKTLLEDYINYLFDPNYQEAKTIRGANLPVEGDNRPNWIGECMQLESNTAKISCLRRLKEMAAMNPFYQYRIDRFIDAITQTYEPTDQPGTVPGNQLTESAWEYEQSFEDRINLNKLEDLIGMKNIKEDDLNTIRQTMQPILFQLYKNAGGDYRGRKTFKNSKGGDTSGIDLIKKYLPDNWEDIARKYIKSTMKNVAESGFDKMPKGWTKNSVKKFAKSLTNGKTLDAAKKEGFFKKCVNKMKDHMSDPEGFCAAVKDETFKSTYWRGKDKTPQEVGKDVKAHKNVK